MAVAIIAVQKDRTGQDKLVFWSWSVVSVAFLVLLLSRFFRRQTSLFNDSVPSPCVFFLAGGGRIALLLV